MNTNVPLLLLDDIVLEEICLEGLEGITIEGLWTRLTARLNTNLHPVIQKQVWDYILEQPELQFYQLAEQREPLRIFDRRKFQDPETGTIIEPDPNAFTTFKYVPINKNGEQGSCSTYDTRIRLDLTTIKALSLAQLEKAYGRKLIVVGSQKIREFFLFPDNYDTDMDITHIQYCLLERIGRSRFNGEKTIGSSSLLELAKDSTLLFYQRTIIQKYGLVTKQPYIQKIAEHHTTGVLLQIPRYYHEYKPQLIFNTEKVVEYLKTKPKCMADYDEVKNLLNARVDTLKNLVKTADFQKVVMSDQKVPYRTLYPDATEAEWKSKKFEEKHVRAMTLIDPNVDLSTIWYKEEEPEDISQHFINYENDYFDKSLLRQAFDVIAESKHEGISQSDLAKALGQHKLTTRTLVRNVLKMNVITSYMTDEGRQRITKYILPKYSQKQEKCVQDIIDLYNVQPSTEAVPGTSGVHFKSEYPSPSVTPKELQKHRAIPCDPAPPLIITPIVCSTPVKDDTDLSEYSYHRIEADEITTEITITNHMPGISKQSSGIGKAILRNTLPSRHIKRCTMIRNSVRDHKIRDPRDLQKEILAYERLNGEKHQICKKSCYRLLDKLAIDNLIRIIQVYFRYKNREKLKVFVCDMSVNETDSKLIEAIRLQKVTVFCNSIEKDKSKLVRFQEKETDSEPPTKKTAKRTLGSSGGSGIQLFSMSPKFFKMKTLHEFMYGMIYESRRAEPLDKQQVIERWKTLHGSLDFDEVTQETGDVYSEEISWRMFVPPLSTYAGYPPGWALLSDLVGRMPLSIFVNVNNLFKRMTDLNQFLEHPIKRHYLVRNLPAQLRNDLYYKRKYIFSVDEIARNLCFIGLLQLGQRRLVIKDQIFVYLNRHGTFLDTTSSDPGYNTITPKEYPTKSYSFQSAGDVAEYWNELQRVCTATALNKRDTAVGKELVLHTLSAKPDLQPYLETQTPETALLNDISFLPGDQLGAGGLDSAFFSHLKKNWTKVKYKRNFDNNPNKQRYERITKKSIEYGRLKKDINKRYFRHGGVSNKKVTVRPLPASTTRKRSASGIRVRKINSRKVPLSVRKHLPAYDDVDKEAIRLMNKLRVDWRKNEDNNLLLCRVAMKYLTPGARKQYLTGHSIRDILHWMDPRSMNKTSRACTRRIAYMLKKSSEKNDSVNMCLEEVRTNAEVREKFGENFVDNLKAVYKTNTDDFLAALKIHFVNLVQLLTKYYDKLASNRYRVRYLSLPDSMTMLRQNFLVKDSQYAHMAVKFLQPITNDDIATDTVMLLIHSSMCCAKDKTNWNIQLFDVYKNYSEKLLNNAMTICRSKQLISQNKTASRQRRNDRNIIMTFNEHFYHLSNTYINQLATDLQYEAIEKMKEKLVEFLRHNQARIEQVTDQKFLDCTPVNIGLTLMLSELLLKEVIQIQIEVPDQVITIDPETQIDRAVDDTMTNTQKRLRFGDDEENIVYYQNPIERLMHFDYHYYHIFCLITNNCSSMFSHLFQINENGLCSTESCLFERNLNDIVDTTLTLISTHHSVLSRVLEHPATHRLERSYQLAEENLLAFFVRFVSEFETTKSYRKFCQKDVGRGCVASSYSGPINFVEVLHDILELSTNYNSDLTWFTQYRRTQKFVADEEEDLTGLSSVNDVLPASSLYDTDKVRKLHDVFVVNSSKLLIAASDDKPTTEDLVDTNKFITLDNMRIPRTLVGFDGKKRDEILANVKSDFTWPQNDRNANDLKQLLQQTDFQQNEKTKVFQILEFIKSKEALGATVFLLKEKFTNVSVLVKLMTFLWNTKYVLRTGVEHVTYVHYKFVDLWTVSTYHIFRLEKEKLTADGKRPSSASLPEPPTKQAKLSEISETEGRTLRSHTPTDQEPKTECDVKSVDRDTIIIRPAPWIRVNGSLNRRVVDRWLSGILLHVVTNPGVTLQMLSARFSFLVPVQVRYMLEMLEQLECVDMCALSSKKVSLFSSYTSSAIAKATEFDSMKETFVEVKPDALTKLTLFIGTKLYKTDFIENI